MIIKLCIFLAAAITMVAGFDLGPAMRIASCRSLCLRSHHEVRGCKETPDCYMCWKTCRLLENDWTVWGSVCQDDQEICFTGCKTACAYHATRIEDPFLPSTLPAPMPGPVYLEAYDVAIAFRKIDEDWKEMDQYPGDGVIAVNKTTWIVVMAENGVRQYSGEFWKPNLETLKEGALFEASLTWSSDDVKENESNYDSKQQEIDSDIARLNSKMALDFENDEILKNALKNAEMRQSKRVEAVKSTNGFDVPKINFEATTERYDKVYSTPSSQKSSGIENIKLYFASDANTFFDEQNARILSDVNTENNRKSEAQENVDVEDDVEDGIEGSEERPEIYNEEPTRMETTSKNSIDKIISDSKTEMTKSASPSYIVSWEPEAGGLMGNQVTDAKSTQISLLPGTKYLVRIASNDGPGSFALEIDTTVKSVQFALLEAVAKNIQPWAIFAGCMSALILVAFVVLVKLCRRTIPDDKIDYV